jgi:hypothetical protein
VKAPKAPKIPRAARLVIPKQLLKKPAAVKKQKPENKMRRLQVEKIVVNICVGEAGDRLTRAAKVLETLTGQTPVYSRGMGLRTVICRRSSLLTGRVQPATPSVLSVSVVTRRLPSTAPFAVRRLLRSWTRV